MMKIVKKILLRRSGTRNMFSRRQTPPDMRRDPLLSALVVRECVTGRPGEPAPGPEAQILTAEASDWCWFPQPGGAGRPMGLGTTSVRPPAASIAWRAEAENPCACTLSFLLS